LIFYACDSRSASSVEILKRNGWGRLFCAEVSKPYDGEHWAVDNGAYKSWQDGTEWNGKDFMDRIEKQMKIGNPDFAVVPDIPTKGLDSLKFSLDWREKLTNDWKWYLAIQDGMSVDVVESVIGLFDGLFLGGSNRFKGEAEKFCNLAHRYEKKFHYARASTRKRIHHARRVGADSIDSAFPFWIENRRKIVEQALIEPLPIELL